jgi:hypothetical protein
VDFEIPAHSRPWTFPGAPIYVDFKNADDEVVDSLDPTIYGLFQDPGTSQVIRHGEWEDGIAPPADGATWVWEQRSGFQIVGANDHCDHPHGNYGYTPHDVDRLNCAGQHEHVGIWYYGTDQTAISPGGDISIYRALLPSGRSTRLPAGEYTFDIYTYGYVMRRQFPMFIPTFGAADIEADVIQGGQVRAKIEFFNEGVKTPFNGWVAVEVFDAKGALKGASIYGQAQPNCFTRASDGADGCTGTYHWYEPNYDWQIIPGPSQGTGLNSEPYIYENWENIGTATFLHRAPYCSHLTASGSEQSTLGQPTAFQQKHGPIGKQ